MHAAVLCHGLARDVEQHVVLLKAGDLGGAFTGDADDPHAFDLLRRFFVHADAQRGSGAGNGTTSCADDADAWLLARVCGAAQPLAEGERLRRTKGNNRQTGDADRLRQNEVKPRFAMHLP